MGEDSTKGLSNVIRIDDERVQDHPRHIVRGSVEETLNALLDAETDRLVGAGCYERTETRRDTRAGSYDCMTSYCSSAYPPTRNDNSNINQKMNAAKMNPAIQLQGR